MVNYIHIWEYIWNPTSSTLEPDRLYHDRPTVCVIAQQYSSITFISLRLHSRKEKYGAVYKNVITLFLNILELLMFKLRNLILRKSESVCVSVCLYKKFMHQGVKRKFK
jgi:hypothetical protein